MTVTLTKPRSKTNGAESGRRGRKPQSSAQSGAITSTTSGNAKAKRKVGRPRSTETISKVGRGRAKAKTSRVNEAIYREYVKAHLDDFMSENQNGIAILDTATVRMGTLRGVSGGFVELENLQMIFMGLNTNNVKYDGQGIPIENDVHKRSYRNLNLYQPVSHAPTLAFVPTQTVREWARK